MTNGIQPLFLIVDLVDHDFPVEQNQKSPVPVPPSGTTLVSLVSGRAQPRQWLQSQRSKRDFRPTTRLSGHGCGMGKNGGRKDAGINPFKDYLMMVG